VTDKLTVGHVAARAQVSADAVRYYERLKLLPAARRTAAGYRIFDSTDVDRVRAIRRAQTLGMSLGEIRGLFPQGPLGQSQCHRVRRLLAEKIAQTDARISELREFGRMLRSNVAACDRAIAIGGDAACPILTVPKGKSMSERQR
jgi:MerR family copper efflux transcriptional regulator